MVGISKLSFVVSVSLSTLGVNWVDAAFGGVSFRSSSPLVRNTMQPTRSVRTCMASIPSQTIIDAETTSSNEEPVLSNESTDLSEKKETFVNNGAMAWMNPYLDSLGIKEGKTLTYGVFTKDIDKSIVVPEAEVTAIRKQAAEKLENIGAEERKRRDQAGTIAWAATFAYAVWASLFADDGDISGHFLRFLVVIPSFLALGYKRSAELGICNIAQAGFWDVDGNGLTKVEDPNIAQAILDKVNAMNLETAIACFAGAAIFGFLPQSTTAPLAFFAVVLAVLYALRDKIPEKLD